MIEVKNLVKRYGDHVAVNNLSFTVEEGQIYGFLGPNGAGKSTTMNIITMITMKNVVADVDTITTMIMNVAVDMITKNMNIITMTTTMNAVADMIIMIITIIMQMRYLQAGARRHHTSTMRTNSERSLTLWLTQRSTVLSSEQRVSYLAMQVSGCTLILYQASLRSERARLTSLVSFA